MNQTAQSLENMLQELVENPAANNLAKANNCACHIINPKVHRLILWPNLNQETGLTEYTLRIGSQRFTSLANIDKLGQTYWRFQLAGYYADGQTTIDTICATSNP